MIRILNNLRRYKLQFLLITAGVAVVATLLTGLAYQISQDQNRIKLSISRELPLEGEFSVQEYRVNWNTTFTRIKDIRTGACYVEILNEVLKSPCPEEEK